MSTKENIQQEINSRLQSVPTQIEGGTIQDMVGSVSYELAYIIDTMIEPVIDNAFVTTADREHLLIRGGELGVYVKPASNSRVLAVITGASPMGTISEEIKAKTENNIVFKNTSDVIADENGRAEIIMECLEEGSTGNIAPDTLTNFYEDYSGLQGAQITNPAYGYDGYDEEETEEYRERILEFLKNDACNSNIADYKMWAKSQTGVKHVVVEDAMIAGAGKVNVYISAVNNAEVTQELINATKARIEKEQIINAIVHVYPLEYVDIDVSADIVLQAGSNITTVIEQFEEDLTKYLNMCPNPVSYLFILNLLFENEGVADVLNYTLNGDNESIALSSIQIPVIGTTSLEEEDEEEEE